MKKIKYRNNNYNNQVYSINYKFDSVSPAGKFSGTALDLIKRYNELAKEAHANGNYIESEVFRQYAEHYRKIITEINERKNSRFNKENETNNEAVNENVAENGNTGTPEEVRVVDEQKQLEATPQNENNLVETKAKSTKKSFTVIEVSNPDVKPKAKRTCNRNKVKKEIATGDAINE